jgi:phosphate transport system substrate-binding protein
MKKLTICFVLLVACGRSEQPVTTSGAPSNAATINGAGATFPYPLYSKWFSDYSSRNPNVRINYQSIGSGGGIRQLLAGTVDFGATDSPMTDEQLKSATTPILHLPTTLGAVVPVYNVPGAGDLNLSAPVLADIILGKITNWNDKRIGANLPDLPIVVVHRSDVSGTTFILCDYLSKISPEFKSKVGANTSVQWPTGLGAKGNEGITGLVKQTPGAIGYVELVYALQNRVPYASVNGIKASIESVTAAAAGVAVPDDFRVSITNPKNGYPIASFTWILLPQKPGPLVEFMRWALTDGQKECAALGYAPLPKELADRELAKLSALK